MDRFDVVIVGCGVGGCSAGYVLADNHLKTLIIERGGEPGEKNVMGGVLYLDEFKKLGVNLHNLPRERRVTTEGFVFPSGDDCSFVFRVGPADNAYTVFRSSFDKWFSNEVEKKGVMIVKGIKVKELIKRGDEWVIVTDAGEVSAPFVVGADGVNSIVARKTGLRSQFSPEHFIVTVKEVIAISRDRIESRFNLKCDEGAIYDVVGIPYIEVGGGGFIYTNKDTISIGAGARLSTILSHKVRFPEYIEYMKRNPAIRRLIEGGELVEYSVHMIPFGGVKRWGDVVGDGVLLVGDAMGSILPDLTGAPFAVFTGRVAGEIIREAYRGGINTKEKLKNYYILLKREGIWRKMRRSAIISLLLKRFPDFLSGISYGVNNVISQAEDVYGMSTLKVLWKIVKLAFTMKKDVRNIEMLIDKVLDFKIGTLSFRETEEEFISVGEECDECESYSCVKVCPAGVYTRTETGLILRLERCMECGACRIACGNIKWDYPRGGKGVVYRFG